LDEINTYFGNIKSNAKNKEYYTTANVGLISGGKAANQVPDYAEATIDIRYTPDFDVSKFENNLNELIKKIPNASYQILVTGKPNLLNLQMKEVNQFKLIAKKMYGIDVGSTKSHGATDARFFSGKGIPVMIVTPNGGDIHSKNEWMNQEDFHRFYRVFKEWAEEVGKINQ
ncbi:MAG: M20 family metallopeptidase, partial [bacterium]|nr:M20 family metallopeptidase [bacterium]